MPWSKERRREYRRRQYRERRRIAHRLLGACQGQAEPACVDCGSTRDLELDHREPADKLFNPLRCYTAPWGRWLHEVLKCVLRCSACHLERTVREGHAIPPGRQQAAEQLRQHLQRRGA